jgi:hypothetical protein
MSWAGLSSNQCVSCNNLQDAVNTGVFTLKNTIPSSTKLITKNEAADYVNLNTAYAPFASKTSNQLVVKSNLQACINLPYSYTIYYYSSGDYYQGFSTSSAACTSAGTALTVYSNSSSITAGAALYTDSCGNNQLYAESYNTSYPYFKYGGSYITFENWDGTNSGYVVRTVAACAAPTTATIYWTVGNQSGGNLKVLNSSGTELLNISSSAGSIQTGTLNVPVGQLPYTIRGSWAGGSGNIIKFRVCDDYGSELYYSGSIAVGESADYTPSPTPTIVYVYLNANNVNPPICAI